MFTNVFQRVVFGFTDFQSFESKNNSADFKVTAELFINIFK